MTALTNYAENALLDHLLGTSAMTSPTNVYVKLHTGDPGEDATANAATETTRVITGAMSAASGGSSDNDAVITFSAVSTTETITHISIWDAITGGNPLLKGALDSPVALTAGDDFELPAGDLIAALD